MNTYAITIQLNDLAPAAAYAEIGILLSQRGFNPGLSGLYWGSPGRNAVECTLAVMRLNQELSWFAASVSGVRMLRVEANDDLMPAIYASTKQNRHSSRDISPLTQLGT